MKYLMNQILFLLMAALAVKAYHRERDYQEPRKSSNHHDLITDHVRGVIPRDMRAELRQKSNFQGNHESKEETGRRPQSGPTGNNQHIQYSSEKSSENHPKLFLERNRERHFDSESKDDSSDMIKYSHNKERDNNDRSYHNNYPQRQSQPAYSDSSSGRQYRVEEGQKYHEPKNMPYSHNSEADASREFDRSVSDKSRNLRHESSESGFRDNHPAQYVKSEGENRRPLRYSHSPEADSSEYPIDKQQEKRYLKANENNYESQSHPARPKENPPNSSGQYYDQDRPQYEQVPYQTEHRGPPHKNSQQQYPTENVPYNSDYRDGSLQEPAHIPSDKGTPSNYQQDPDNQSRDSSDKLTPSNYQQNPESQYYAAHDLDSKSSSRQPNRQNRPVTEEARSKNKAPLHQQRGRNAMRIVETKKDMQPAPSEADSQFSEEHDGFLDMGAYTDKQGSFGWYADFPVGKEHDKVTYSFS